MRKLIITCDFCGADLTEHDCTPATIDKNEYDICKECIPKPHREAQVVASHPAKEVPPTVAEPEPILPQHPATENEKLSYYLLPKTCYAYRWLEAYAKGKPITATHQKTKAMQPLLRVIGRSGKGEIEIIDKDVPQLVKIIKEVNRCPYLLEESWTKFSISVSQRLSIPASTVKAYRALFIEANTDAI
jgi:hypothetical protein